MNINRYLEKKHNNAIILGCGSSINQLTVSHLKWLNTLDIWTSNNFIIHDFIVPNFYNVEVKMGPRYNFLKRIINQKKEQYKNVNWLIELRHTYKGKKIIPDIINPSYFNNICLYRTHYLETIDGNYTPIYGKVMANKGLGMSIIFDMVGAFEYDILYLLGIDLYSSEYFWTSNKKFDNLNIPKELKYNKASYGGIKNKQHETASKLIPFLKEYIKYNNINVINLSKKSLLSEFIATKDIKECIK